VSRARAARRLATAAAYGGGGLGLMGGSLFGLVKLEAKLARRSIGPADIATLQVDGTYEAELPGEPLSLLVVGDSVAAGYGAEHVTDTPSVMLAIGLAHIAGRPVRVTCRAKVGARSAALDGQLDTGLEARPDVTVIIIGANDVTHSVRPSEAVRDLDAAVRRIRATGSAVVVGTCPDLGGIQPIPPPLRQIARAMSRRMAAAQTITVVEAGGVAVSMGELPLLSQQFVHLPGELFGADRFHPSVTGYASMSAALLPAVAGALDLWDGDDEDTADTVLPISFAAVEAAGTAGTEVSSTRVGGQERGPRGRWVQVRRRRAADAPPEQPTEADTVAAHAGEAAD
jgi:lysophospholipase L1-like esterase